MDAEPLSARAERLLDDPTEDRHDEAIDLLRRAVAGRDPVAPALLARAYLERGQRSEAIALLAPRVRAGRGDLACQLGDALASVGDTDRAEDAYLVAIAAGDVAATNTFGVFLRDRGRLREAERMLRRAAEAGDDLAPMNLVAVQLELYDGPDEAAGTAARWADESRPSTLLAMAFVRAAQRRYDEAGAFYRRAAELGAYRGHIEYAWFLQDVRDDVEGAERELGAAEREDEPGWALAFGRFLADEGRTDEARAYLEHSVHWGNLEAAALLQELDGDPYDD